MKLVPVKPEDISNVREAHRGRVSYPIIKGFLESGEVLSMIDRTGMQQSFQSLYSSLSAYIRSHNLPIKLFSRRGQIYLLRLDLDDEGNPIPDWTTSNEGEDDTDAPMVTGDEAMNRMKEEEGNSAR